jgi:hypothetical protein
MTAEEYHILGFLFASLVWRMKGLSKDHTKYWDRDSNPVRNMLFKGKSASVPKHHAMKLHKWGSRQCAMDSRL